MIDLPPPPEPSTSWRLGVSPRAVLVWLWGLVRALFATAFVFGVFAILAAVAWHQLVHPALWTKTGTTASMGESEVGKLFAADAWFMVLSAGFGLLLGVLAEALRRGDAVSRVIAVAAAGLLAAWVMSRIGLWLGPPDPKSVLASVADGATIPTRLEVRSHAAYLVWPFASVAGVLVVLLLRPRHAPSETPDDDGER